MYYEHSTFIVDLVVYLVDLDRDVDLVDVDLEVDLILNFCPPAVSAAFLPGYIWGLSVMN